MSLGRGWDGETRRRSGSTLARDRVALVERVAASAGVEVARLFKLIQLALRTKISRQSTARACGACDIGRSLRVPVLSESSQPAGPKL
jgi:hypothetical protein